MTKEEETLELLKVLETTKEEALELLKVLETIEVEKLPKTIEDDEILVAYVGNDSYPADSNTLKATLKVLASLYEVKGGDRKILVMPHAIRILKAKREENVVYIGVLGNPLYWFSKVSSEEWTRTMKEMFPDCEIKPVLFQEITEEEEGE